MAYINTQLVRKSPRLTSEHVEQSLLFQWAETASGRTPELSLLFAIPNGGHRAITVAKKLKAEGVKAGVPDICLPVARRFCHALYIEMKVGTNKPTATQLAWHDRLRSEGNQVATCWNWEQARDVILDYLRAGVSAVGGRDSL